MFSTALVIACFSHIESTGWVVLSVIGKAEIIAPIIWIIIIAVSAMTLSLLLIGLAESIILSRRFSVPHWRRRTANLQNFRLPISLQSCSTGARL